MAEAIPNLSLRNGELGVRDQTVRSFKESLGVHKSSPLPPEPVNCVWLRAVG